MKFFHLVKSMGPKEWENSWKPWNFKLLAHWHTLICSPCLYTRYIYVGKIFFWIKINKIYIIIIKFFVNNSLIYIIFWCFRDHLWQIRKEASEAFNGWLWRYGTTCGRWKRTFAFGFWCDTTTNHRCGNSVHLQFFSLYTL